MTAWALSEDEREDVVRRLAASISAMSFFGEKSVSDQVAEALAAGIERKAYTAAEVASNTTTGQRPKHETTATYARKMGSLVVEALNSGVAVSAGAPEAGVSVSVHGESLVLGGEREFYDADGARTALAPLLAKDTRISSIRFSTKSFGRPAAEVAREAIINAKASLVDADLSDVIAGRPEEEAKDALRIMAEGLAHCQLRSADFSHNALGEKGIRACQGALVGMTTLESLTLENVGLSVHACKALEELLKDPSSLKKLHLANNMSDDEGARSIAALLSRTPAMEDFKFVYCRVKEEGGIALAGSLQTCSHLVSLDLTGNPMGPEAVGAIAGVLSHQQHLRILRLGDTLMEDSGVAKVCTALAHSAPYLEELDLSINEITKAGAQSVARCIIGKPGIVKLNLRENELGDAGVVTICKALMTNSGLKVLDLCENQIRGPGGVAAAKTCAKREGFEQLGLDGNWMPESTVDEIRAILASGTAGAAALGPMDDNDEDMADDEEDEDDGGLADAVKSMGI